MRHPEDPVPRRIVTLMKIEEGGQGGRPRIHYFEAGEEVDAEVDKRGDAHVWLENARCSRVTLNRGEFRILSPLEQLARCAE